VPKFIGRRVFKNFDLAELASTSTGARSSRPGTWPALPGHPRRRGRGREARKVFADGQAMLQKIIEAAGSAPAA
jgi:5-methyltetrahydrofolate--homocysteine methyltransferase